MKGCYWLETLTKLDHKSKESILQVKNSKVYEFLGYNLYIRIFIESSMSNHNYFRKKALS